MKMSNENEKDRPTVLEPATPGAETPGQVLGGKAQLYELLGEAVEVVFENAGDELSEEAWDAIQLGDAVYLGDLVQTPRSEVALEYGEDAATQIDTVLRTKGLHLGMVWEGWWPEVVDKRAAAAGDPEDTQPDALGASEDEDEASIDEDEEEEEDVDEDEDTVPTDRPATIKAAASTKGSGPSAPPPPSDADPGSNYSGPFRDVEALRDFLRRILYGLPPGRSMEPKDDVNVRRHLPANVAKKNAIEVVRDLAIEDIEFAKLVVPVLSEFTGSIAKGEWQACLTAMVQIANKHPGLDVPGLHVKSGKV